MKDEVKPSLRDIMKDFALNVLLDMADPDPTKEIETRFLSTMVPSNWKEKVYEFENKYLIETYPEEVVGHEEESIVWSVIKKEFGDNIICIMAEKTPIHTVIRIQLKKSNYQNDISIRLAV